MSPIIVHLIIAALVYGSRLSLLSRLRQVTAWQTRSPPNIEIVREIS
jgi:hypothetical protein